MIGGTEGLRYQEEVITGPQIRAARALIDWSQDDLARESGVSARTIKRIELGHADTRSRTLEAIRKAFDRAGVVFLEAGTLREGGDGIRFKS